MSTIARSRSERPQLAPYPGPARPLRIAFLTTEFVTEPTFDGGLAQYLGRVTRALSERGHEVEVFTISGTGGSLREGNVAVHRVVAESARIDFFRRQICRVVRQPMYKFLKESFFGLTVAASLRRAFVARDDERPFDVVQATNLSLAPLLLRGIKRPVVVRLSSELSDWNESYGKERTNDDALCSWLSRVACRNARVLYAPSRRLAHHLKERQGLDVRVVRPTFELEATEWDWSIFESICETPGYLLFHGTIGRLKGVGTIVEALDRILPRNPDMRMIFIGKDATMGNGLGSGSALLRERLGKYGDRVKRLDRLPHSQLYPILSKARGSVLPSLTENLSNAALEAMGLGRVVIGTRGASFEELIEDGRSGLLVEIGDVEGLADAMERIWRMPEGERDAIGKEARRMSEEFSPEKTVPLLEELFRTVIEQE